MDSDIPYGTILSFEFVENLRPIYPVCWSDWVSGAAFYLQVTVKKFPVWVSA